MTQAIQQAEAKPAVAAGTSLIHVMAERYGLEPTKFLSTLIKTVFPSDKQNPSNEQVAAFLTVAKEYGLNPFIKEIYAFPGKGGGIVPIVSIDGWSTLINRQSALDGIAFDDHLDETGNLRAITAIIHRKDRAHPIKVTEYMSECARNTEPWQKWPARMLRHKALIQCARVAFGLAGIYDPDEAERIAEAEQSQPGPTNGNQPSKAERLAAQLQNHPAVAEESVIDAEIVEPETPAGKAESAPMVVDEKTEKKKLRKSIKDLFPEDLIDRHTGNKDINALSLDELVQLKDALSEYKE